MYQTINEHEFIEAFDSIRPDNFTRRARQELFEWYSQFEDGTGEQIELDVIAICCDWAEYNKSDLWFNYEGILGIPESCSADAFQVLLDRLQDETTIIRVEQQRGEDTFLVLAF